MNALRSSARLLVAIAAAAMLLSPLASVRAATPTTNRYGGPIYNGSPIGDVTAELLAIGGTPGNFSSVRTLNTLVGADTVTAEVKNLQARYGPDAVDRFIKVFDYTVNDAWSRAGKDNVAFPPAATLSDHDVAVALVQAGTAGDGTFWTGLMLDKLVSHKVHDQVMVDIDAKYGEPADASYHKIANRLFYDIALILGAKVTLASFH